MSTDKITTYLEQLELSPLETKIYLTLLHEGELTPQYLIAKLKVHRTSIYPPLESLFARGLISKIVNGKHTKFSLTDPKKSLQTVLKEFTIQKKEELKEMELAFPTIVKEFPKVLARSKETSEAETKFYNGKAGVKKIYEDVLKSKEQRSYVDEAKIVEIFPENLSLFNEFLEKNPQAKIFEIFQNSSPTSSSYLKLVAKKKNYFYKYLPKGIKLTAQDIFIYDGKVAIISFKDRVSGMILQNRDLYSNFKKLFDVMWNLLPEAHK